MRLASIVPVLAVLLLAPPAEAAPPSPVLVDTCGQVVPPKAAAYLAGDLDCSSSSADEAVALGWKSSLDLGGFTITTGTSYGIRCDFGKCVIENGTVRGAAFAGIVASKSTLENLTVTTTGTFAAILENGTKVLSSTITGPAGIGIYSISGKKVVLEDSTVTGHGRFGVWATKVVLEGSTVTGNMNDPECSNGALCADLLSQRRPRLKDSSCGRSDDLPDEPIYPDCLGWCVCTDD